MQVDVRPAMARFSIRPNVSAAVQDVRHLIDLDADLEIDPQIEQDLKKLGRVQRCMHIINSIFGTSLNIGDEDEAVLTAQAMIEHAAKNDGVIEDIEMAIMAAHQRVKTFMSKPENRFFFVKAEGTSAQTITETKVVGGVETTVAVNKEGGFKKGEKQRLAEELYKKFQESDPRAADPEQANKAFIGILMEELGMTKSGATTYAYNLKNKFKPDEIKRKPKRV